ncbi:MAG: Gfo/Idh/MocA family oxidoreductase [Bacteroidales bacterium]|nr:Gfo/Idh/MocA family oxidoreductase [Bacteroidales bacterium]
MLKIGVLGAGHLGKIHINCLKQIGNYQLVGFYDQDPNTAAKVAADMNVKNYTSIDELIDSVDVVDVVTPTIAHFACASKAIANGKNVFIEKPIVATVEEANGLVSLAKEAGVKVQVGHVERFNPAFIAAEPHINDPLFIEAHRLALFNPRGCDVPVVLDLTVHDIDIVLTIIKSKIKTINASGVSIVSPTPDITTARIEFENGAVANLTTSRISLKNMRKFRIFQKDAYITMDLLEKKADIVKIEDVQGQPGPFDMTIDLPGGISKKISVEELETSQINAIKTELERFHDAIINGTEPPVTIEDGVEVLKTAYMILDEIHKHQELLEKHLG